MLGRAEISLVDDVGKHIAIGEPARRIIATAPHLAELVYAAGSGDSMVAAVRGANYPSAVLALPTVGDAAGLDFERIRRLEPDLILAWGSGNRPVDLNRLALGSAAVVILEARRLEDIPRHLRIIGELGGSNEAAERAAARFEGRLRELRQRYSSARTLKVVVEIWHQPLFTVGDTHLLSDALRVCGARNALPNYPLLAGPVPIENVLAADVDIILSVTGVTETEMQSRWGDRVAMRGARAVELISLDPDLLTRASDRMVEGVEMLCRRLDQVRADAVAAVHPGRVLMTGVIRS